MAVFLGASSHHKGTHGAEIIEFHWDSTAGMTPVAIVGYGEQLVLDGNDYCPIGLGQSRDLHPIPYLCFMHHIQPGQRHASLTSLPPSLQCDREPIEVFRHTV